MPGYAELEFDLPSALLQAVINTLDNIEEAPLTVVNTQQIPNEQGIYALYHGDEGLVYVGKTDRGAGLRSRLTRHAKKLIGRLNIVPADVSFKAVRVYVFTAMDIEQDLIQHYGNAGAVSWNKSGFGSNDPGKERDTTTYKPEHWDFRYPIDLHTTSFKVEPGPQSVAEALGSLKSSLPFLFRFERPGRSRTAYHPDWNNAQVNIPAGRPTAHQVLQLCGAALPQGWHITKLPSHIIAYKDDRRRFPSGERIA